MNVIIVIILLASFNFLMEYNSYTNAVHTNKNEQYYLIRQISEGALVRNEIGNIIFLRWDKIEDIEYSVPTSANIIIMVGEKRYKIKLLNKAPKTIIFAPPVNNDEIKGGRR